MQTLGRSNRISSRTRRSSTAADFPADVPVDVPSRVSFSYFTQAIPHEKPAAMMGRARAERCGARRWDVRIRSLSHGDHDEYKHSDITYAPSGGTLQVRNDGRREAAENRLRAGIAAPTRRSFPRTVIGMHEHTVKLQTDHMSRRRVTTSRRLRVRADHALALAHLERFARIFHASSFDKRRKTRNREARSHSTHVRARMTTRANMSDDVIEFFGNDR